MALAVSTLPNANVFHAMAENSASFCMKNTIEHSLLHNNSSCTIKPLTPVLFQRFFRTKDVISGSCFTYQFRGCTIHVGDQP